MAGYQPINAGDLDQLLYPNAVSHTLDANRGPQISTGSSTTAEWCRVRYLNGREFEQRGQTIGDASVEIAARYNSNTSALRTKDQWRTLSTTDESGTTPVIYEIESIQNPHERGEYLIFMCRKVEAQS